MISIKCQYCGESIGPAGLKGHFRAAHNRNDYAKELAVHGLRQVKGRLVKTDSAFDSSPTKCKYTIQPKQVGPHTLTITEEAMAIALTGLERIQADLAKHVDEVRAQLNKPGDPWPELARQELKRMGKPIYEAPVQAHVQDIAQGPPKLLWAGGRHWSNDRDNIYLHHMDGTLKLDASGQPRLKGKSKSQYRGPNPSPNALRLRKIRAQRKQAQTDNPEIKESSNETPSTQSTTV